LNTHCRRKIFFLWSWIWIKWMMMKLTRIPLKKLICWYKRHGETMMMKVIRIPWNKLMCWYKRHGKTMMMNITRTPERNECFHTREMEKLEWKPVIVTHIRGHNFQNLTNGTSPLQFLILRLHLISWGICKLQKIWSQHLLFNVCISTSFWNRNFELTHIEFWQIVNKHNILWIWCIWIFEFHSEILCEWNTFILCSAYFTILEIYFNG